MISVCLASYNGEKFIQEQLRSILCQLADNDEVVVSDDGSRDKTVSIIQQFNDRRIRLFCDARKKGAGQNFDRALRQAKGELIFLADQDDVWEKEKIITMQAYLAEHDLAVSDCSVIDLHGNALHESFFERRRSGPGILKNLWQNTYMGCCMAFTRKILNAAVPLPQNVPMHDWWLGMVAEIVGTTVFCPEKLVRYRRHENNETPFAGNGRLGVMQQLRFRKNLAWHLFQVWAKHHALMADTR